MIILDFGSANTCQNNFDYAKKMIDSLASVDTRLRKIVIKWQLFDKAGNNIPLNRGLFAQLHKYAWHERGYETTASVFDIGSLEYLLKFNVPFIKIANRPDLYHLADRIPDSIRVIKSVKDGKDFDDSGNTMACVSQYPAEAKDYEKAFKLKHLKAGISDHTTNWDLFNKFHPALYECHFCLEDSTGLDSGPFSRRPIQLKEIL